MKTFVVYQRGDARSLKRYRSQRMVRMAPSETRVQRFEPPKGVAGCRLNALHRVEVQGSPVAVLSARVDESRTVCVTLKNQDHVVLGGMLTVMWEVDEHVV